MIRVAIGLLCTAGGLVLGALSASALSVVGTGEVTETEPFAVGDEAYALVLDQAIVPFDKTDATLTVESDQELFIGTANGVDADDYLTGVAHEDITDVEFPETAIHRTVAGDPAPVNPPDSRDWWTHTDTGTTVSHTFDLEAAPQVIVVTPAAEDGSLADAQVTLSMDVHEVLGLSIAGFAGAVALLGVGAFYLLRWWFGRFRPRPRPRSGARSGQRPGRGGTKAERAGTAAVPSAGPGTGSAARGTTGGVV